MSGIELIAAERARQLSEEGWTVEHDDEHNGGELVRAAVAYADCNPVMKLRHESFVLKSQRAKMVIFSDAWPWGWGWYKPSPEDPIRNLVKAGALIAAEIDRMQRTKAGGSDAN